MPADAYTDEGTDIKSEANLHRRNIIDFLNRIGLIGVCFFSELSFLLTCIWFGKCQLLDLVWGRFGSHIMLMSSAFLLIGPMASVTFRLLVDYYNVRKKYAQYVHAFLQLLATSLGIAGVRAVWISHEDRGLAYLETGSYDIYHFHTSHSILGIFAISIYVAQLIAAFFIFFLNKELRKAYRQLHMAVGQGLIVTMIYVAALGMLYYEAEAYNLSWDDVGVSGHWRPYMTATQYSIVFLMFSVILVFYAQLLI